MSVERDLEPACPDANRLATSPADLGSPQPELATVASVPTSDGSADARHVRPSDEIGSGHFELGTGKVYDRVPHTGVETRHAQRVARVGRCALLTALVGVACAGRASARREVCRDDAEDPLERVVGHGSSQRSRARSVGVGKTAGPPPNYEPDVAGEIPLAGIPEEPDLEGGGLVRAETEVNPPTVSEPGSENRVLHDRLEDELPPATRRRIESEIAESVARNQVLDGVPQLANRGAIEGETGCSLALRERSRSPGRAFLAIADFHSCESDDLEYVWNFRHSCEPGQSHRWESCKGEGDLRGTCH